MNPRWTDGLLHVDRRQVAIKKYDHGTIFFDPNFLGSGYARKLYAVSSAEPTSRGRAHRHVAAHLVHLIEGANVRLAYQEPDGRPIVMRLEPGYFYYVPSNIPHQFEFEGRMISEEFSSSTAFIASVAAGQPTKEILETDLFTISK